MCGGDELKLKHCRMIPFSLSTGDPAKSGLSCQVLLPARPALRRTPILESHPH